jgi:hypothetical protein
LPIANEAVFLIVVIILFLIIEHIINK